MSCCGRRLHQPETPEQVVLEANIHSLLTPNKKVVSLNSIGDFIRVQVRRGGVPVETTDAIPHVGGSVSFSLTTDLQNGDEVCVQLANEESFNGVFVEDCLTVPTPRFTFVSPSPNPPSLYLRWDEKQLITPNSPNAETVEVEIQLTDNSGQIATVTATGKLAAFNIGTDEDNPLEIDGQTPSGTIATPFGIIQYTSDYPTDYNIAENISVAVHVTDHRECQSAAPHTGITNAIITEEGEPLTDEQGSYLLFIE